MPSAGVQVSAAVLRLARELRTALDQRFAPLGLTSQQAGLLIHVFTGQAAVKGLAELLGTDSAGMTRLLDRLEVKGYLVRSPDRSDRRAILVELTDAGLKLIPQLPGIFEQAAADLLRGMDPDHVGVVVEAMLANLQSPAPRPPQEAAGRRSRRRTLARGG
jgi:DNA-binding MarR family transcriptional regulator